MDDCEHVYSLDIRCTHVFPMLMLQTSASLKFTVLNPKGRIWTMVAGGGASVIYADTVRILVIHLICALTMSMSLLYCSYYGRIICLSMPL